MSLHNGIQIHAQIVADTVSPAGSRITTFLLEYPRYIHAQIMTHRMLSRNAQSSRAMPVSKSIERLMSYEHQVLPDVFMSNQKGMQPGKPLDVRKQREGADAWYFARQAAANAARQLAELGVHKQWANRLLEPFSTITALYTGTSDAWEHYFRLRKHGDAQDEIRILASLQKFQYDNHTPVESEVHAPFCDDPSDLNRIKQAIARCARVSYLNFDGNTELEKDLELYDKLVNSDPPHASPLEHIAYATPNAGDQRANFRGWESYRYLLGV